MDKTAQTDKTGTNQTGSQTASGGSIPDSFNRMGVKLDDLPVLGYERGGTFTPASQGQPPKGSDDKTAPAPAPADKTTTPEGQPPTGEPPEPKPAKLTAVNGKEFSTQDDLLTAYNESSSEGQRLHKEFKTSQAVTEDLSEKLREAHKTILSLQESIGKGGFPKSFPKPQKPIEEMNEEEKMAYEEEKATYFIEKKEWTENQETLKKQIETAKADSEAYQKQVREIMERSEKEMSSNPDEFPDFTTLKPLRERILEKSPWMDNRPETPYLTWLLSIGLVTLEAEKKAKIEAEKARQKAAAEAGAEAGQAGKTKVPETGGSGGKKTEDTGQKIVSTYQSRSKPF